MFEVPADIWVACDDCAALVRAGRWEILVELAVARLKGDDGMARYLGTFYGALRESMKEIH